MARTTINELKALTAQVEKVTEMDLEGITSVTINTGKLKATVTKTRGEWSVDIQEIETGGYFDR